MAEAAQAVRRNHLEQPIGPPLPGWVARPAPPRSPMLGRLIRIEPLDPVAHAEDLYQAVSADRDGRIWTYLPQEPVADRPGVDRWLAWCIAREELMFHAFIELARGRAVGIAAYMNIHPAIGVMEIGHILFAPALQRTATATEAMYIMMRRAFDELGYRRYEWKCDSLNAPSRRAAERLGFRYEGTFRNAMVYKGRSRDTAWFSITDEEWPALRRAFERWLDPANFDGDGAQRVRLEELRAAGD